MKHNFSTLKDSLRKFDSKFLQHLMVAGLLFFSVASMNAQNLVVNPGFEDATSTTATGWAKYGNMGYSTVNPYAGTRSVWLGSGTDVAAVKQIITGLQPNTRYTATAMYFFSAEGSVTATFGVRNYLTASTGDTKITLTPILPWTATSTVTFTTSATSTQAEIYARMELQTASITAKFDNFSLVLDQTTGLERSTVKNNVYSNNSNIVVEGLAAQTANVYSVSGAMVKSVLIKSDLETIAVDKGFYIVKVGGQNFKLLIQ